MNSHWALGAEQTFTFTVRLCTKWTQPVKRALMILFETGHTQPQPAHLQNLRSGASEEQQMPRKWRIWGKFLWTSNEELGLGNSNRKWKIKMKGYSEDEESLQDWELKSCLFCRPEDLGHWLQLSQEVHWRSTGAVRNPGKMTWWKNRFEVKLKDSVLKAPRRAKTFRARAKFSCAEYFRTNNTKNYYWLHLYSLLSCQDTRGSWGRRSLEPYVFLGASHSQCTLTYFYLE